MIDRRLVNQMLVTLFERNCGDDVLTVMMSVLDMSAEDRARIQEARRRHGIWGMVTTTLEGGEQRGAARSWMPPEETPKDPKALADLWVDFLLTETESGGAGPGRPGQGTRGGATAVEENAVEGGEEPQKPGGRLSL